VSVWADAASRYREGRELRTSGLKGRFIVQFEGGTLAIQLPSGVIRRVDSAEFASAWTLIESGAQVGALRLVTPSALYLQAIREDLLGAGLGFGDVGSDDDTEVGTTAAALISEATARSAPPEVPEGKHSESARLEAVEAERDELVRELARAKAALSVGEERLATQEERANQLEAALAAKPKDAPATASIGAGTDPMAGFVSYVATELKAASGMNAQVRAGIQEALDLSVGHPELALVQCRKVAEAIARAQYLGVTGASQVPPYHTAVDCLMDVQDREGVDMVIWNLHRNVFRLTNRSAHVLTQGGSRQLALTIVAMVLTVANHVRTDG